MDLHFWSYALLHNDTVALKEFLGHKDLSLKK